MRAPNQGRARFRQFFHFRKIDRDQFTMRLVCDTASHTPGSADRATDTDILRAEVASMKSVRVKSAGGDFEIADAQKGEPAPGYVRIKVQACGVCHSDMFTKEGAFPGIVYPRSPGHEIAGVIDAAGDGAGVWKVGDRVGVGWHGGHCGQCEPCRHGDFVCCEKLQIPGISYDGGYAEFVIVPAVSLARIPAELTPEEAGPIMCAGVTTFNPIRNTARPGDLVAVQGIGGLGHLGVQYASKFGCPTVAIGRGADKKELAIKLGAHDYLDSATQDIAKALTAMGGAKVILATAPDPKAIGALVDGLAVNGKLVIVGASGEPFGVSSFQLIGGRKTIMGWPSGTAKDSEEALRFAAQYDVRPMIEVFPLDKAADGYQKMITGKVRFRSVLKM
jgi:D-arabinose 1-dehydrogenase-like Zn-dependent alcohol dehydrogenase